LKAYISVAGPDLLTTGTSEIAKDIIRVDINRFHTYHLLIFLH